MTSNQVALVGAKKKQKNEKNLKRCNFCANAEERRDKRRVIPFTCSRSEPSSKMGSSAAAVSSSVCIFPACHSFPPQKRAQAAPTPATSDGRTLPGGVGSVTPSAASRTRARRWRGLRQIRLIDLSLPPPLPALLFG